MTFPVLQDKVIIVTGAARGIGEATARLAAAAGAKVVIADVNEAGGQAVADSIVSEGGTAAFVKADVSDGASVEAMVESTVQLFGRLDGAVNNAAIQADSALLSEFDEDYFDRLIGVELKGVALCLKYELRQLIKQGGGGSLVNISSANGFRPQFNQAIYTSTKHGIIGLTQTAAIENGQHGTRINALAPGAVETPMLLEALEMNGLDPAATASLLSVFDRFGQPSEMAEGAVWLLSDNASYVTGTTLHVDGGYTGR
ncbi:SDR family NAD(P)-dependent oxidoreductase [Nocardioides sp. CPCC 206347]|uniref:SDR family NAD(P)-dependent oxidoreductase n=1 Tax=unclassified Nocardioides TaxID=2615069 RepID=UPI0036152F1C